MYNFRLCVILGLIDWLTRLLELFIFNNFIHLDMHKTHDKDMIAISETMTIMVSWFHTNTLGLCNVYENVFCQILHPLLEIPIVHLDISISYLFKVFEYASQTSLVYFTFRWDECTKNRSFCTQNDVTTYILTWNIYNALGSLLIDSH